MRYILIAGLLASAAIPASIAVSQESAAPAATPAGAPAATAARPLARPPANAPYRNASLPVAERVADLLARMTLEEKIAQITSMWQNKQEIEDPQRRFNAARASARFPNGLGQLTRPSDFGPGSPRARPPRSIADSVAYVNAAQRWATTQTRLGIPIMFHEEALHGLAARDATSFPQAIGLASTWDPDLIRDVNQLIAGEVRARGVHLVLSPVVDVARDPRWGRIEETFGEDPYLVSEMGVAAVEGLQGPNRARALGPGRVFATLKHMTGHGQPESGTNTGPAPLGERTLREDFFPPFEAVVRRTGIDAVMASYNEIDGLPSHANRWLLEGVLRGEWGYEGAVVSDYFAIEELQRVHRLVPDIAGAARTALAAGVDADFPDGVAFGTLTAAVRAGEVSEARIDAAVTRMLTMKFNAGLFENPYANLREAQRSNGPEGVALALRAAERSLILLKNDNMTLPLSLPAAGAAAPTIAVIGPSAHVARLGGYYGLPRRTVSPLEGIRTLVGDRARVVHAEGVRITENDDWWVDEVQLSDPAANRRMIAEAVEVARNADRIILFIGDTEQTSREGWAANHLGDRTSLDLVGQQQELFDAMKALGKPVIVVLVNGRPPSYPRIAEQADAILESWYAGEQQGNAIANALFGLSNPGGRLPVTVARNAGQLPIFYNHKPSARRGYLFDTTSPLYPFGFGLSYTTFSMSEPRLSSATMARDGRVTVSVDVRNTGARAGDEVVQLYIRDRIASVTRPVRELRGFRRITLAAGESRTVTFTLDAAALSFWNADMRRVVEPGEFEVMVGANAAEVQTTVLTVQ